MFRHLFFLLWVTAVAASTNYRIRDALARLPQRLAQRLDTATIPSSTRHEYYVSTKTADKPESQKSDETESWWPLWRSSASDQKNSTSTETEEPAQPKKTSTWPWSRAKKEEEEKEEDEAPKEEPKKKRKKRRESKKKKEEDEESEVTKEEPKKKKGESEATKEEPKSNKKDKSKSKKEEEVEPVKETEGITDSGNTTDTSSTNTTKPASETESDRKREALERYKELYKLRQQMLAPHPPGRGMGPPLSPDEQYRQMRNAETSMAMAQLMASLIAIGARYSILLWLARVVANRREQVQPVQHFIFERVNDRFVRDAVALKASLDEPPVGVSKLKWGLVLQKRNRVRQTNFLNGLAKLDRTFEKTSIVVELQQDQDKTMDLGYLADLVTFLLSQHQSHAFGSKPQAKRKKGEPPEPLRPLDLEVIFQLSSPGGAVATFGLAAAQLKRLRGVQGITTTVCVDKYAASGGYMIASQANKLVAAPFAYIGSIGVIMETLNFHDILRSYGVTPVVLKAGQSKNPLTTYGPVTKKEMEVQQAQIERVHDQFKEFAIEGRPQLEDKVATVCDGSVYMGGEALGLNLVDDVMTSEEYLMQRMLAGDRVLKVYRSRQSRLPHHLRFPTFWEILPHLRGKIESFLSRPDIGTKLVQVGSCVGFLHHLVSTHMGKEPKF